MCRITRSRQTRRREGTPALKKLENKWLLACLAFLVPAVLLLVIFALNGVTPFGGRSLAEQDANIQYIEEVENQDGSITFRAKLIAGGMSMSIQ